MKARFYQDFRTLDLNNPGAMRPVGTELTRDESGVRVTLPANQGILPHTGFVTNFGVRGDFELTLTYEVLREETPSKGYGVGLAMLCQLDSPSREAFALGRRLTTHGRVLFTGQHKTRPSLLTSGRMRLRRVGPVVQYLVAEGDSPSFDEIEEKEFGTQDLEFVRVAGTAGESESALDARLIDFTVLADELPGLVPGETPRDYRWKLGMVGAFLVACAVALGLALWGRRGRATVGTATAPESAPSRTLSVFSCAACGKSLRAPAESAGKMVKCPVCGKVTRQPPAQAASGDGLSSGR
jgi:hypothetical protein